MKKRFVSILLAFAAITAIIPAIPASAEADIGIGEYLEMGVYNGEPVLWRCVDIDENGPLMLSDKVLCIKAYDAVGDNKSGSHARSINRNFNSGSCYWEDSNIRSWLNSDADNGNVIWACGNPPVSDKVELYTGETNRDKGYSQEAGFLNGFSDAEKSLIKSVTQPSYLDMIEYSYFDMMYWEFQGYAQEHMDVFTFGGSGTPYEKIWVPDYSEDIVDKVFLPGVEQLNSIYGNKSILGEDYLAGRLSDSINANDYYVYPDNTYPYWTRCPDSRRDTESINDEVFLVGTKGKLFCDIPSNAAGVRPAFYLDTANAAFVSGRGLESDPYKIDNRDIKDEIVMRAKVLSNNDRYKYYKNVYQSPSKLTNDSFREHGTENWASAYLLVNEMAKILTLKLSSGEKLDTEKYYEIILADILENNTSSENGANVWDNTYSAWSKIYKGYNNDILQKIAGKVTDLDAVKTSEFFKEHTDKKVFEEIMDYSKDEGGKLKEIKVEADILDKISVSADLINDFFDAVDEMLAYSAVQQEKINVLKYLKNTTDDYAMKSACEKLINDIEFAHRNTVAYFAQEFGKGAGKDILDFSHGCVMGVVLGYLTTDSHGLTPYVDGLSEAMAIVKGAQAYTNIVINADGISEKVLAISAYADIEERIKEVTSMSENAFNANPTVETAVNFMANADMLKATLLTSCDIYEELAEEVQKSTKRQNIVRGILDLFAMDANDIINLMKTGFKDKNIEDNIQSCKTSKRYIEEADFYKLNDDIAAYISVERSKIPSDWAKEYVDKAISYNILPDYLQCNYQDNITRAEFCTILTSMIIQKTGKWVGDLPSYNSSNELFKDTYYEYVYYMYCLNIINGVSEDEFQPLGYITREQAAAMLKRTADALGIDSTAPDKFQDDISDWAKDGVSFVVDRGIMNGTDSGFEPQGTYTKEQAITTFVRFYENL